jgi:hypothetical protein
MKPIRVSQWGGMVEARADADGTVRVWDSVAGHYTTCHSLTAAQARYVRAQERKRAPGGAS